MKTIDDYRKEVIELKAKTFETDVMFAISCYDINDERFIEGILEIPFKKESDAKAVVKDMKKEQGCEIYYRPVLVDIEDYTVVTPEKMYYYDNNSEFVKELKESLGY